ncbi:MAG: hypothetical protein ACP5VR_04305 [Acidimicrobiales bacterium]
MTAIPTGNAEPAAPTTSRPGGPRTTPPGGLGGLGRLGRSRARHPWRVIAAWVVALLAANFAHGAMGGTYADNFALPGTPAQQGANLLKAHEPTAGGQLGQVVFTVASGRLAAHQTVVQRSVSALPATSHILSVSNPFSPITVSRNDETA